MGFEAKITKISATHVVNNNDFSIHVDASGGNVDIYFPPANEIVGRVLHIKKTDNSTNLINLIADGTDFIETLAVFVINTVNESVSVFSDGKKNWYLG